MKNKMFRSLSLLAILLIQCLIVNCSDDSTSPNDDPKVKFPLGNDFSWTYKKISNTNVGFDSLYIGAIIDTVKFTLTANDTVNDTIRYLFSRETDYDNILFSINDTIFSAEFYYPEANGPCLFLKDNFTLNEKWDSWFYSSTLDSKPGFYVQVNNEITNLDTIISLDNYSSKVCDVIQKYYLFLMSSATEQWFFSDGIGIIRIDGTRNSGDDKYIYRYELIDYSLE
jgi:hypothetical protein